MEIHMASEIGYATAIELKIGPGNIKCFRLIKTWSAVHFSCYLRMFTSHTPRGKRSTSLLNLK